MKDTLNLHEIDERIVALFEDQVDLDTGEVLSDEEVTELLNKMDMNRNKKILNCEKFREEHKDVIDVIKTREAKLAKRKKKHERKVKFLKRWIEESCNVKETFTDGDVEVSFLKSVRMDVRNEEAVPDELWVYPPTPDRRLDKVKAKRWMKDHDGEPPPGIDEIRGTNLQVK